MKELTYLEKLEHVMNVFSKRVLPGYLFGANPELYLKWQGNICKQTAVLGTFVIKKFIENSDYVKIEAWEGFFNHEKLGDYNHCWNYIVHKDDPSKNIICDFTSTISYMHYCDKNDPTLHISPDNRSVVQSKVQMIGCQEIDYEEELKSPEFYTERTGKELIDELTQILNYANLW